MKRLLYKISALVIAGALALYAYAYIKNNVNVPNQQSCQECSTMSCAPKIEIDEQVFPSAGFQSLDHGCSSTQLKIEGSIPSWMHGTLLRVGPGKFEMGNSKCDYAFDGFATLYSFKITPQSIEFAHCFLSTGYYKKSVETGVIPSIAQKKSLLGKLSALAKKPDPYDNNSVNIVKMGDHYSAMTLTLHATEFNPLTLQTKGPLSFNGIDGHVTTPYPCYDADTKRWYNVLIQYGTTSCYQLYSTDESLKSTVIASIKTKSPAYIHSIAMTPRYCIIPLIPFTVSPSDLLFSGKPFVENFVWQDNQPTQFIIIDKKSGAIIKTLETSGCFVFNQINAFEQGNNLILDMLECPKTELIDFSKLCNVRNPDYKKPPFSLVRYTLNPDTSKVQRTALIDKESLYLASINPTYSCKDYTYVYAIDADRTKIYKINVKTRTIETYTMPGSFAGTPLFVAKPGTQKEDDGMLLVVMLDAVKNRSYLVFIDALTMKEKARAYLPHALPFDMGGLYTTK